MKKPGFFLLLLIGTGAVAQYPDAVYSTSIKSVQLYQKGNQLSFPFMSPNSIEQLELHFDDLEGGVKNYYYTFQLCNADWTPAMLSQFDYLKGFSNVRLSLYRNSSVAFTRYTHYQATVPDRNSVPTRSGNYILKVFRDNDTSKLIITKRVLIVEEKSSTAATVQQPFNGQFFRTHQKIQFKVNLNERLNVVNHLQQLKVVILQNNRWDNAITDIKPSFFSRNQLEFNTEVDCIFPAGKEWRWLDLRSFRLQSDRILNAIYGNKSTEIFVKPDMDRSNQRFNFFRDNNGMHTIETTEGVNPYWQGDYAKVNFSFVPPNNLPLAGRDVYIIGQLNNYFTNEDSKLTFNSDKGVYESSLFLKMGYYDYTYVTIDPRDPKRRPQFDFTEGNYWESENEYTILVYYRALGGRADELVGYTRVNSITGRQGIGR
ncbi:MAG: DUF5103 domain-containing protein [Chitinophagaceae bacterium]|nr:DUF5103 domain-containing protein [Chitinophagaceae bacterium]